MLLKSQIAENMCNLDLSGEALPLSSPAAAPCGILSKRKVATILNLVLCHCFLSPINETTIHPTVKARNLEDFLSYLSLSPILLNQLRDNTYRL